MNEKGPSGFKVEVTREEDINFPHEEWWDQVKYLKNILEDDKSIDDTESRRIRMQIDEANNRMKTESSISIKDNLKRKLEETYRKMYLRQEKKKKERKEKKDQEDKEAADARKEQKRRNEVIGDYKELFDFVAKNCKEEDFYTKTSISVGLESLEKINSMLPTVGDPDKDIDQVKDAVEILKYIQDNIIKRQKIEKEEREAKQSETKRKGELKEKLDSSSKVLSEMMYKIGLLGDIKLLEGKRRGLMGLLYGNVSSIPNYYKDYYSYKIANASKESETEEKAKIEQELMVIKEAEDLNILKLRRAKIEILNENWKRANKMNGEVFPGRGFSERYNLHSDLNRFLAKLEKVIEEVKEKVGQERESKKVDNQYWLRFPIDSRFGFGSFEERNIEWISENSFIPVGGFYVDGKVLTDKNIEEAAGKPSIIKYREKARKVMEKIGISFEGYALFSNELKRDVDIYDIDYSEYIKYWDDLADTMKLIAGTPEGDPLRDSLKAQLNILISGLMVKVKSESNNK